MNDELRTAQAKVGEARALMRSLDNRIRNALETWERFYERVVKRGSDWPHNLWLAAVEDGLRAALPAQSRLLVQYRQDVAALQELERAGLGAGLGSYRDSTRAAQLEADIMRVIGLADQAIREEGSGIEERSEQAPPPPARRSHPRVGFWLGALIFGVIALCGALLGATYYHQVRMNARMKDDLTVLQHRLIEQAATQRAAFEGQIKSGEARQQTFGELRANVDEFDRLLSAALHSMTDLGAGANPDLERQLRGQDGDLGEALKALRERAASLEGQLVQIADSLGVLTRRLPELDRGANRLARRLEASTAGIERIEKQVATIQAQAPELALRLEGQRQALAKELEARRKTMGELAAEIGTLRRSLDDSRGQLATLEGWLEQSMVQVEPGSGDAEGPPGEARSEQQAIEVDGRAMEQAMQKQIDAVVSELAGKAGLAAQRSEEIAKQAEAEARQRLETATAHVLDDLSKKHRAQLAELTTLATTSRDELGQTRDRLVAGWQGMDQAVAQRQSAVLSQLDQYAATLEVRVQELLEALDVIAARPPSH
jgi:septal ring factor EnvC (AmiA/AmiB activator)